MRAWFITAGMLLAATAWAGPKEEAKAKKKEADRLIAVGEYEAALTTYEAGYALVPDPGFELGRADALLRLRRYEEAKQAYERYIAATKPGKAQKEAQRALENVQAILETSAELQSTPSGARVYLSSTLDGLLGTTPLRVNLPPGTHRIIFAKEGFLDREEVLTVFRGDQQSLRSTLAEIPSRFVLRSNPPGAEVFILGERKGVTPLTLDLPPARHELVFRWKEQTKKVSLAGASGEEVNYLADFSIREGTLGFVLQPAGALVRIDGRGEFAPPAPLTLTPGPHTVEVRADGYQSEARAINLQGGEELTLEIALQRALGATLVLRSNIKSPVQFGEFVLAPNQPLPLSAGTFSIKASEKGFFPLVSSIRIEEKGDATLAVSLSPKPFAKTAIVGGLSGAAFLFGAGFGLNALALAAQGRDCFLEQGVESPVCQEILDTGANSAVGALVTGSVSLGLAITARQIWKRANRPSVTINYAREGAAR